MKYTKLLEDEVGANLIEDSTPENLLIDMIHKIDPYVLAHALFEEVGDKIVDILKCYDEEAYQEVYGDIINEYEERLAVNARLEKRGMKNAYWTDLWV